MGLTEVGVFHGLSGRETLAVVVAKEFVQQVQCLSTHQMLVLTVDKLLPPLARVSGREGGREGGKEGGREEGGREEGERNEERDGKGERVINC